MNLRTRLQDYYRLFREEPEGRWYLVASFIDDLGIAASLWASQLIMTRLYTSQAARASVQSPILACLILGVLVGGPLADWFGCRIPALARRRWQVVLLVRTLETIALGYLTWIVAVGSVDVAAIIPYVVVGSLLRALVRPARQSFEADMLRMKQPQVDGPPIIVHLPAMIALKELSGTLGGLGGLAIGGWLVTTTGDRMWVLFAVDVASNVAFIAMVIALCRPQSQTPSPAPIAVDQNGGLKAVVRGAMAFVASPANRAVVIAAICGWMVAFFTEAYDGKMMLMHELKAPDNTVRVAEFTWQTVSATAIVLLPFLGRKLLAWPAMLIVFTAVDGIVFLLAGMFALHGGTTAIPSFIAVLSVDVFMTVACGLMVLLLLAEYTPAELRGRVIGGYLFAVLMGNLAMENLATIAAKAMGIPLMMVSFGAVQCVLGLALLALPAARIRHHLAQNRSSY